MIPHIIHYCWFGKKPLPRMAHKCVDSWRRHMPEYEIRLWTEDDFDLSGCRYVSEAYAAGKYAFVSDYARFLILYNEGGIYFDTDVELLRSVDSLVADGPFMGREIPDRMNGVGVCVAPGLGMAMNCGNELCRSMLELYSQLKFVDVNGTYNLSTVGEYITPYLINNGLVEEDTLQIVDGIQILPERYLCPKSPINGRVTITPDTFAIHHYSGSWTSDWEKLKKGIQKAVGPDLTDAIINLKRRFLCREVR